ncbi:MAG: hypothetical protein IT368_18140, partial [Candidatus Hydrogenedentes bacterium]|nr:hypothetical protein [Candidatus Hydrogenedentota bacterium]
CNECSIAKACPSDAFSRVPASTPYIFLTGGIETTKSQPAAGPNPPQTTLGPRSDA